MTVALPVTREGFEELKEELNRLKTLERPRIIKEIASARELGDLSENAEYHAAREKQGMIEARILDLDDKLSRAQIIEYKDVEKGERVRFGAYVTLSEGDSGESKTYRIVGDMESDIKKNKISLSSPIARALIGKKVDDNVEVQAPKGTIDYTITEVRYD